MKVLSVQVGQPRPVEWQGKTIETGIFKTPVSGAVAVRDFSLVGDRQADLRVHGGPNKAIYAYPSEHYPFWKDAFPALAQGDPEWGLFGENLTLEGVLEQDVSIGDVLRIGSAELRVAQPRSPCLKLGLRTGQPEIVRAFQDSGRNGFYLGVVREGELRAGDPVERIESATDSLTIAGFLALVNSRERDPALLEKARALTTLGPEWTRRLGPAEAS